MRAARLAAAAVLVGTVGSVGLVAGSGAASGAGSAPIGPTAVTFTTPATSGQTMNQRPVVLNGDVSRPGGYVDSIAISVAWTDQVPGRVPGPHPTQTFTDNPDIREPDVPWDVSPEVAYNGQYTVTVVGTTDGGTGTPQQQTSGAESFIVDIAPAVPANVVATANAAQRVTQLKWTANTEPDLIGYAIIRGGPTTANRVIGTVEAPQATYTDDQVATEPAGTYRYWVEAIRQNGAGTGVDQSAPSAEADVAYTTPPKAAAPPSPTTAAPGKGSSSTPGATGSTGPAGSTGSTATGTVPTNRVALPPVTGSLPDYQALLNQAQNTTVTTAPPDPGYSQHLPYPPQVARRAVTLPAPDTTGALGAADIPTNTTRRTSEFLAAALLLGVLAMFALFIKRSADQAALLEALAPEGAGGGFGGAFEPAPTESLAVAATVPAALAGAEREAAGEPAAAEPVVAAEAEVEAAAEPVVAAEPEVEAAAGVPGEPLEWSGDHGRARERRRMKWSERASRLAVALAAGPDADPWEPGQEASAPPSELAPPEVPLFERRPAPRPEADDLSPLLLVLRGQQGEESERAPVPGGRVPVAAEPVLAATVEPIGKRSLRSRWPF